MTCIVCSGTGWMTYPHPDGEGGLNGTASGPCPECIEYEVCPSCDRDMLMAWGALLICVHCGFTFDWADEPVAARSE